MKRRNFNVFGLSFLDVMFCGFGSVILLVMIVNSNMIKHRQKATTELRAESDRLEKELEVKQELLVQLKNSMQQTDKEIIETQGLSERVLQQLKEKRLQLGELDKDTVSSREHINQLQSDLKALEERTLALQAMQREQSNRTGKKVRTIRGEGNRQYLTGLKMGGKRVLILVDRSASMLDETIVNIILKRNQSSRIRLNAPKWRRTVATVEWLLSQLPASSSYQIAIFNRECRFLLPQQKGWLKATDGSSMDQVMGALKKVMPEQGTSLYQAFHAIKKIQPRPDNIFLITDGLPTQGKAGSSKGKVTGQERLEHFVDAIREIPKGVPVNIILFPIEGDPMASSAFWKLAVQTKGSFVSPSKDWP